MTRWLKTLIILLFALNTLACGQKGPLYLPSTSAPKVTN
ncbi:MAG TPA: hypothetical protein DCG13_05675 [Legionellales bacterium]|nr:hypothetical protein [Legionellales bacterium]HCA89548.1 hypothetical protein [Legionellales bacterium]